MYREKRPQEYSFNLLFRIVPLFLLLADNSVRIKSSQDSHDNTAWLNRRFYFPIYTFTSCWSIRGCLPKWKYFSHSQLECVHYHRPAFKLAGFIVAFSAKAHKLCADDASKQKKLSEGNWVGSPAGLLRLSLPPSCRTLSAAWIWWWRNTFSIHLQSILEFTLQFFPHLVSFFPLLLFCVCFPRSNVFRHSLRIRVLCRQQPSFLRDREIVSFP